MKTAAIPLSITKMKAVDTLTKKFEGSTILKELLLF